MLSFAIIYFRIVDKVNRVKRQYLNLLYVCLLAIIILVLCGEWQQFRLLWNISRRGPLKPGSPLITWPEYLYIIVKVSFLCLTTKPKKLFPKSTRFSQFQKLQPVLPKQFFTNHLYFNRWFQMALYSTKTKKNDPLTSKTEFPKRPFTCINIKIITPAQRKGTDIKLRVLYECKLLNHNAIDFIFI